jgi:hypothetical protein
MTQTPPIRLIRAGKGTTFCRAAGGAGGLWDHPLGRRFRHAHGERRAPHHAALRQVGILEVLLRLEKVARSPFGPVLNDTHCYGELGLSAALESQSLAQSSSAPFDTLPRLPKQ